MSDDSPQYEPLAAGGAVKATAYLPDFDRCELAIANPQISDRGVVDGGRLVEVSLPKDIAAKLTPGLLHGLSVGQTADRVIPHWNRTSMPIDAPALGMLTDTDEPETDQP